MSLEKKVDFCLASQEIRDLIDKRKLIPKTFDEARIQPSSYEPVIGEEIYVIDTETNGLFRPTRRETVYRTLLQLPKRQRQKINISCGFEIKKGFTYLVRLEDKVRLNNDMYLKSSPKSSLGRLFINTRMLSDYNPCFDEVHPQYSMDSEVGLWLLVQPLAFNVIISPGISLNHLRFLSSHNAKLTPQEIEEQLKKNNIFFMKDKGSPSPVYPIITDGIHIHLDISGQFTEGIVGLRARHNPIPIDLTKKNEYNAEFFFEPLLENDKGLINVSGEHYLMASKEILNIPQDICAELRSNSNIGIMGPIHFAGFIENNFQGNLVFEIRSDELSNFMLSDETPISKLDLFKSSIPDKLYGDSAHSNYKPQIGPTPPKYFREFDFTFAARNYKKLSRHVLVQDANLLKKHRKRPVGFEAITTNKATQLYNDINNGFFQSRYDCESDEELQQPIPYVIIFGPGNTVFSYVRASNINDFGDERLFGKYSIGLGGHIIPNDKPDFILNCIQRELKEEIKGDISEPRLLGTLIQYDQPVDIFHFGLIFSAFTDNHVSPKESSIIEGRMVSIGELTGDKSYKEKYETWSQVLIPILPKLYASS